MTTTDPSKVLPAEGDVAYFVHLHLDTAEFVKDKFVRKNVGMYQVDEKLEIYQVVGKSRPMLVSKVLPERSGQHWFRVIPITTSEPSEKNKHLVRLGKLRGSQDVSFLKADDIRKVPGNLLSHQKGRSCIVESLGRLGLGHVLGMIARHNLMAPKDPSANSSTTKSDANS